MKTILGVLLILAIVASFYILCAVNGASAQLRSTESTPELPLRVFLPAIWQGDAYPIIYDCDGSVTDAAWLTERFGDVSWTQGVSGTLVAIRPCCGSCAAVHVAHIQDTNGQPIEGATVVFYWPDAPMLPKELWNGDYHRGVYGPTNENGDVGFGLGPGAYYFAPAGGPHVVWPAGSTSYLAGIGMLGGTDHEHLDSVWTLTR